MSRTPACGNNAARHYGRTAMIAALAYAMVVSPASADVRLWNAGSGNWSAAANWTPVGVPLSGDVAIVGQVNPQLEGTVSLDQDDTVAGLAVVFGYTVRFLDGFNLDVNGTTTVSGTSLEDETSPSTLIIHDGAAAVGNNDEVPALETENLELVNGAQLEVDLFTPEHGIALLVNDEFTLDSTSIALLRGDIVLGTSGGRLRNDGRIEVVADTVFRGSGDFAFDLDGTSEDGRLLLHDKLTVNAVLDDDFFDGEMTIYPSGNFTHDPSYGLWGVGQSGTVTMDGGGPGDEPLVTGSPMAVAGSLDVVSQARMFSDVNFRGTANVSLEEGLVPGARRLELYGETTLTINQLQVPHFDVGQNMELIFKGPTSIEAGFFTTASDSDSDGMVAFVGETDWHGDVIIHGVARQIGNATVTADTTIDADVFDMSSASGNTWNINDTLVVNADRISSLSNTFFHALNVNSGGRLVINLQDPDISEWQMAGTMNLTGPTIGFSDKLRGSAVLVTGEVSVTGGAAISADTTFSPDSTVDFVNPSAYLRLSGQSHIAAGITFTGNGSLQVGDDVTMTLDTGVLMGQVGLVNRGRLEIGGEVGTVVAASFSTDKTDAILVVDVGVDASGPTADELLVSLGTSDLAGTLEPAIANVGPGFVAPTVGQSFTVLTSPAGINGTFAQVLDSHIGGLMYEWLPVYDDTEVRIQVAAITGLQGDYNMDGRVDAADYVVWRNTLGSMTDLRADGNLSGTIDADDYTVWASNFGDVLAAKAGLSEKLAVPEPACLTLAFLVTAFAGTGAPRRRPGIER